MREKLNIRVLGISVSILGMVLLLLISPCNVRNYIQSNFGVSQTEVNNKSKVVFSNSECVSFKTDIGFLSKFNPFFQYLLSKNNFTLFKNLFFEYQKNTYFRYKRYFLNSKIPLYILFQNIKIYL